MLLCDGLGHGGLAAAAAQALVAAFRSAPTLGPRDLLTHLHRSAGHTRGAVAGVAELDLDATLVRFAGIGNVAASVHTDGRRRSLVSLPGIVGQQARDIREFDAPLPPGALLVLHSDGLNDRWDIADHIGLRGHPPVVIAATLLRTAATRRDDAAVLVATA